MKYLILYVFLINFIACSKSEEITNTDDVIEIDESLVYSFTYDNSTYEVIKQSKTWEEAVTVAVSRGGFLAEINDYEEQEYLFSELVNNAEIVFTDTSNRFGFAATWLGANDITTEGTWIWDGDNDGNGTQFWNGAIDGNSVNDLYNNWGNEPDNNGNQDALCMGLEETPINAAGLWTDLDGDLNTLFFIIEYN